MERLVENAEDGFEGVRGVLGRSDDELKHCGQRRGGDSQAVIECMDLTVLASAELLKEE